MITLCKQLGYDYVIGASFTLIAHTIYFAGLWNGERYVWDTYLRE